VGKDLASSIKKVDVAEVVHHGEKLILPEGMTIESAIDLLYRTAEYMDADVTVNEKFDVFPFDGAYGLSQVLIRRYGWAQGVEIKGGCGLFEHLQFAFQRPGHIQRLLDGVALLRIQAEDQVRKRMVDSLHATDILLWL